MPHTQCPKMSHHLLFMPVLCVCVCMGGWVGGCMNYNFLLDNHLARQKNAMKKIHIYLHTYICTSWGWQWGCSISAPAWSWRYGLEPSSPSQPPVSHLLRLFSSSWDLELSLHRRSCSGPAAKQVKQGRELVSVLFKMVVLRL